MQSEGSLVTSCVELCINCWQMLLPMFIITSTLEHALRSCDGVFMLLMYGLPYDWTDQVLLLYLNTKLMHLT